MLSFRNIIFLAGLIILTFAFFLVFPICIDIFYDNDQWVNTFIIAVFYLFLGGIFLTAGDKNNVKIYNNVQILNLLILFWPACVFIGSLPFSSMGMFTSFTDCLLESASAICLTGIHIEQEREIITQGLLFFKGEMQLFGASIFVVFILDFFSKFSDVNFRKSMAIISSNSGNSIFIYHLKCILLIYISLAMMGMLLLSSLFKFPIDKAFCYIVSLISTGGSYTDEIFHLSQQNILFAVFAILFMFISGISVITLIQISKGKLSKIFLDIQLKIFTSLIFFLCILCFIFEYLQKINLVDVILDNIFSVVAAITGNWINNDNLPFILGLSFLIVIIGSCAGSPSGGIKISRLITIKELIYDKTVLKSESQKYTSQLQLSNYIFAFLIIFFIATLALLFCGLKISDSLEIAYKSLLNIGTIDFSKLEKTQNITLYIKSTKLISILCMLTSRIEYLFIWYFSKHCNLK